MATIVAVAILPILAVLIFNEVSTRQDREGEVRGQALQDARQVNLEMDRLITGATGILDSIAAIPVIRNASDSTACHDYLAAITPILRQFLTLAVVDAKGDAFCRGDELDASGNFADRGYYRDAMASPGQLIVGTFLVSRVSGKQSLPLSMAFRDASGNVAGVVIAALDLDRLDTLLLQHDLSNGRSITIADREGTIIAGEPFPDRFIGTKIPVEYMPLVTAQSEGTVDVISQDGTPRILGYMPATLPPLGLYVSTGIAQAAAFEAIDQATLREVLLIVVSVLLAAFLAVRLTRRLVSGPISRIAATMQSRRDGDEQARTGLRGKGELESLGAALDIYLDEIGAAKAARDRAEQHRELVMRELSHRMKNMFAMIQAVAGQTFRGEAFRGALTVFNGRIATIAESQQLLMNDSGGHAPMLSTIRTAIAPFEPTAGLRFDINGPALQLGGKATLALSMAIHELCTNAVKYGALSTDAGRVSVTWRVEDDVLQIIWRETGGPEVSEPASKGFGSRLIEGMLAAEIGGRVTVGYEKTGLSSPLRRLWRTSWNHSRYRSATPSPAPTTATPSVLL